jgi:hypothetical protein
MRRKKLDRQLSLKCADPLYAELAADAERRGVLGTLREILQRKQMYASRGEADLKSMASFGCL